MGRCVGGLRLVLCPHPSFAVTSVDDMVADFRPRFVTDFVTSTYPARILHTAFKCQRAPQRRAASSSSVVTCGMWGFGLMLLRSREARRRRRPRCASDTSWSYRSRSAPGCTP
jgi:hypothetical protein